MSRGWGADAGEPSPSPASCLGQTGTSIWVTRTHRGGSLLPSHVHGADSVTYIHAYLCRPHSSAHNQMHTCVYMQANHPLPHTPRRVSSLRAPSQGHRLPCALPQIYLLRRHVGSPRFPPHQPPQMAPGTQEPLLLSSLGTSLPTHQVLGRLGQHGKGGQALALAAGVGCLRLQRLAALGVPVP